jgi:hypothetical protein
MFNPLATIEEQGKETHLPHLSSANKITWNES